MFEVVVIKFQVLMIFVVDDEESILIFVEMMFEDEGYEVFIVSSGDFVLCIFVEYFGDIDVFVIDVVMLCMSGFDLVECLVEWCFDV